MRGVLELEDGTVFEGTLFSSGNAVGEVVFNTGMVGYPESLTDPSYRGQILTFTYPLIGNYGVPSDEREHGLLKHFESEDIHIAAVVLSGNPEQHHHWQAQGSFTDWLIQNSIPGIYGIDTRALTKKLRDHGVMLGRIYAKEPPEYNDPNARNLVAEVSTDKVRTYGNGTHKIALLDCGVKNGIIRSLLDRDCTVIRLPWDHDLPEQYDGLLISNGPGDPAMAGKTVETIRKAMKNDQPIFGICMGNQLLARALGAQTYKLAYGHRSQNQPCIDKQTGRCYITSQNHGFAVQTDKLPDEYEEWFVNANDGTNEGIRHKTKNIMSVQFHPEAQPGPTDTSWLFDDFVKKVKR